MTGLLPRGTRTLADERFRLDENGRTPAEWAFVAQFDDSARTFRPPTPVSLICQRYGFHMDLTPACCDDGLCGLCFDDACEIAGRDAATYVWALARDDSRWTE